MKGLIELGQLLLLIYISMKVTIGSNWGSLNTGKEKSQ